MQLKITLNRFTRKKIRDKEFLTSVSLKLIKKKFIKYLHFNEKISQDLQILQMYQVSLQMHQNK